MSQASGTKRQAVITGIGVLAPQGIGREALLDSLKAGRTGIRPTEKYEASAVPGPVGGEIRDFTDETAKKIYLKDHRKHLKVMGRDVMLGVAASLLGIKDAGLDQASLDRDRIGVEFGSNLMLTFPQYLANPGLACTDGKKPPFHMERWGDKGFSNMEPLWMLKYLPNMPACHVAIFTDSRGPNNSITQDEVSSNLAISEATAVIRRNHADVMVTGSSGVRLHPVKEIHSLLWEQVGWDPDHPEQSVKPFDQRRNGIALGEAGVCVILENDATAQARGANILGTVLGNGSSCVSSPDGKADIRQACANAMRSALRSAGLSPEDIGHVNAHGLASTDLDVQEALAIQDVFGSAAIPVVGLKGYHGNPGASGGMLELAMSVLLLQEGLIPHTLNTTQPDPALKLDVVIGEPRTTSNRTFLNLNYTLIGQASAVVIRC
ncbi:MAG: beta-ketoacyl-[acyl-carrier-protein] synthase family protein [Planctomycetaceae bacterium]